MDETEVSSSHLISEGKSNNVYPVYFGISCAFSALRLISGPDEDDEKWSKIRDRMLQGTAQLLGLLVWNVQREGNNVGKSELLHRLQVAEKEVEELKKLRREDAKANEKVVSIYAAQEQTWFSERKRLRQQIGALFNEFRVLQTKKDGALSELNEKIKELELLIQSKDKVLEEEERKKKELEEQLKKAEDAAEELRVAAKHAAQEHSSELWKHKTTFLELVSNQRQLEAEMGRALRQVEAGKQELDSVLEQKEESVLMVQKLSMEIVKMRKDSEQKDKILSAMLRKSKLDTSEKQMLLKEVKLSKAKRKQAELETERWRAASESRHERHSLKSFLSNQIYGAKGAHPNATASSQIGRTRSQPADLLLEYVQPELRDESENLSLLSEQYPSEENEELVIATDVKQLEGWVRSEAEKYATLIEQRHHLEIDAFAEQMRLKDEKLEAFRWRLMSMELESKRLQSHVEGLNQDMSQLRQKNVKLEALLMSREAELTSLKEQLTLHLNPLIFPKTNFNSSPPDPALAHDTIWSKVKIIKGKLGEEEQEIKTSTVEISEEVEHEKEEDSPFVKQSRETILTVQSPEKEFEEEKVVPLCPSPIQHQHASSPEKVDIVEKLAPVGQSLSKKNNTPWKMDLHALGVSYKIKRLKQQLVMLERLTGKQESGEDRESDEKGQLGIKGFLLLMFLLNKQVSRYQSLQEKIDDLCKRMHESDVDTGRGDSSSSRAREETKALEHFLEDTFQLQRYMVSTGQKLMEMQSKIASGFLGVAEELDGSANFDMKRFADNIRTLFREVQRGLEVRIARIIGDLEGTLACEGIIHLRR